MIETGSHDRVILITGANISSNGSAACEWIVRNSGKVAAETGSPWPYTQPVWVFIRRVHPVIEGSDIKFVKGDARQVQNEMHAAAGE